MCRKAVTERVRSDVLCNPGIFYSGIQRHLERTNADVFAGIIRAGEEIILGTVLPPFVILSVISVFYKAFRNNWLISQLLEGMQAGVGAVIASVTLDMGIPIVKEKEAVSLIIMVGAFVAACLFGINVVYIVIVCGIIGIIRTLLLNRRKMK